MAMAWMEPSGPMEHMVMARRSARKASTSSVVMRIELRWFTPWPMASVISASPVCGGKA